MTKRRAFLGVLLAAACGSSPAPLAVLTVTPGSATVDVGGPPVTFTATLEGASGTIAWSLSGPGAISPAAGGTTVYTPPAFGFAGTAMITATAAGLSVSAAIAIDGCPVAPLDADHVVSATWGSDPAPSAGCWRTIGRALAAAAAGEIVWVAPGTYDAALGEVFPITVPSGVALVGDEPNLGSGAVPTEVRGNGLNAVTGYFATLIAEPESTVTGLLLDSGGYVVLGFGIDVTEGSPTILRNTFASATYGGVHLEGAGGPRVAGNRFETSSYGVYSFSTGFTIIEDNVFEGNALPIDGRGAGVLRRNAIRRSGQGQVGVQVQGGTWLIEDNTFSATGYQYGAVSVFSGEPVIRRNVFDTGAGPAVQTRSFNATTPDVGTPADPGQNDFRGTSGVAILHESSTTIQAQGNSWPAGPNCGAQIVVSGTGTVVWGPGGADRCN